MVVGDQDSGATGVLFQDDLRFCDDDVRVVETEKVILRRYRCPRDGTPTRSSLAGRCQLKHSARVRLTAR